MESYLADHLIKEEIECDTGAFRRPLSGISKDALGMAHGTWFDNLEGGSDLSGLYWQYENPSWSARQTIKEMIRISCLPSFRRGLSAAQIYANIKIEKSNAIG
jgi:hypothetical protein